MSLAEQEPEGFFNGADPMEETPKASSGWAAFSAFSKSPQSSRPAFTPTHVTAKKDFSPLTKLLILLVPLLLVVGYYTYSQVAGSTFLGITLRTNVNLENGLVGHWTFDGPDTSTSTAYDISGNEHNALLSGDYRFTPGKIGQAFKGLGVTTDGSVQSTATLNTLSTMTISFWGKDITGGSIDRTRWNVLANESLLQFTRSFTTTNGHWLTYFTPSSGWKHYVVQYESSSSASDPVFYLNNIQLSTTEIVAPIGTARSDNNLSITMPFGFIGSLDDVRIYNRILSAKEVEALYKLGEGSKIGITQTPTNLETGLVGHWTFDGPDMTLATATDKSGNGNDGTLQNGPAPTIGKVGQGLLFDKIDDVVNAGSANSLDDLPQLSVSAWIKPRSNGESLQGIIAGKGSGDPGSGWILRNNYGNIMFRAGFNSGLNNLIVESSPSPNLVLNEWQHVAVTWSGTELASDVSLYLNGSEVTKQTSTNGVGDKASDSTEDFRIGNRTSLSQTFDGVIDDVRVYNRALSPDEVAQLYALGGGSTIKICKEESVQDADANTYNTLAIGSQCWLDRNMNVGTRIAAATNQTNNAVIEKWCYSNSDANCTTNHPNKPDGGLYQWDEAMQYSTTEGARGICPVGFHIPTDAEWHTLEKFLTDGGPTNCDSSRSGYGCGPAGTKIKLNGTSGFEGNLSGYYQFSFSVRDTSGLLWSSSESSTNAIFRGVFGGNTGITRVSSFKTYGIPVRCLQD